MPIKVRIVQSQDEPEIIKVRRPAWQEFLQY